MLKSNFKGSQDLPACIALDSSSSVTLNLWLLFPLLPFPLFSCMNSIVRIHTWLKAHCQALHSKHCWKNHNVASNPGGTDSRVAQGSLS